LDTIVYLFPPTTATNSTAGGVMPSGIRAFVGSECDNPQRWILARAVRPSHFYVVVQERPGAESSMSFRRCG
jgi:hypothetical protein